MAPRPDDTTDLPQLTLRAKLTVNRAKIAGIVQVFPQRFSWHPSDRSAAEPVRHPATALTGTRHAALRAGCWQDYRDRCCLTPLPQNMVACEQLVACERLETCTTKGQMCISNGACAAAH